MKVTNDAACPRWVPIGSGLFMALTFSLTHAQATLEEVVVTAQKRAQNVQEVPIAVSAFTADSLQERAVTDVSQISNMAPNVTLDAGTPFSGSSAVISAYVRGIGSNDFAFNIDPAVGIYLDGVYLARSVGANQDLGDVERIEVLKGPQGTLFGRNTIGGAISIVTHEPGKELKFTGDATTGSYSLVQVRGSVDIPFSDSLRSSITLGSKRRDGYMKRIAYPGFAGSTIDPITSFKAAGFGTDSTEGGDDVWNARVKLLWDNGGPFKATLAADYSDIDQSAIANSVLQTFGGVFAGFYNCAIAGDATTGLCAAPPVLTYQYARGGLTSPFNLAPLFGVNVDGNPANNRLPYDDRFLTGDPDKTYANGNNFSKLKNEGIAGTLDFRLTDDVALKSITAYREMEWLVGMDLDGSPLNFLHTSFEMNQRQFSEELQVLGSALDGKLNYVGGLYYFEESGNLHDFVTFAEGLLQVDGPNNLATKNYAGFGQIDFRATDLLGFTIGGRYTKEKKEFEGFQSDNNALSYKILNALGVPPCASINPTISESCRIAATFPNPGQPLRYYPAGVNHKEFSNFSPKLGVQLYPADDLMIYASYSRGYKTGGWTTRLSNPLPTAPDFDEEKAKTYEVGIKSQILDNRLQINAAIFSTDYEGIQLNFQQGVSPTVQNAGDARIKGAEIELQAAVTDGFTVSASAGYVDAYYTDVLLGAQVAASPFQAGVFPDAELPKTPKFKSNLSPRYEFNIAGGASVILVADWTHSARLWNDTERTYLLERPATDTFNASATYRSGGIWDVTLGGTNISDERFLTTGQAQLAGGQIYGTYNRPREWYLTVRAKFE